MSDPLILTPALKGAPLDRPVAADALGGQSIFAGDLPFPLATLSAPAVERNSAWMRDFVARHGALLAPHVKTSLCPWVIERQLADGAWALTVANTHQMQLCIGLGARRILIANQVVGPAESAALARAVDTPGLEIYSLVDSAAAVDLLADGLRRNGCRQRHRVLVELGFPGGRCGARSVEAALEVARLVAARSETLALCGVEGFEGLLQATESDSRAARVQRFLDDMALLFGRIAGEGLFAIDAGSRLLTAGGSHDYPLVMARFAGAAAQHGAQVVTRSGCYVSHDHGIYHDSHQQFLADRAGDAQGHAEGHAKGQGEGLLPALMVWGMVLSRPEPGRVIVGAGKRDLGYDAGMPLPVLRFPHPHSAGGRPIPLRHPANVAALSDQHAHLDVDPAEPLAVGDLVGFGVSHPCTTFDRWRILWLVEDDWIIRTALPTFF